MSDPRVVGLMLMAVSILAFLGTTSEAIPAATFFPALVLFAIGAFKFLRTNHEALARAERATSRARNPAMRENRMARAMADRQAANVPAVDDSSAGRGPTSSDLQLESGNAPHAIEIELDDGAETEDPTSVMTDVSFPIEIQQSDALADQLEKLNRLLDQRVLSKEEFAIAKSKLLG